MRTRLLITSLLMLLLLPATALAGHRHDASDSYAKKRATPRVTHTAQVGYLVVENPNLETLVLKLDGRRIGTVRAGELVRLGPFSEGEHKLVSRLIDRERGLDVALTKSIVQIDRRRPVRMALPEFRMTILELSNSWIEGMRVRINGTERGVVPARGFLSLAARSPAEVEFISRSGRVVSSERVTGRRLGASRVSLATPTRASVRVHNPSTVALDLVNGKGRVLATIAPQSSQSVRLRSGRRMLTALYGAREIDRKKLVASPFERQAWTIRTPRTGPVTIRNLENGPAALFIEGQHVGTVGARETATLQMPVGTIILEALVRDERRSRRTSRELTVDPFQGARVRILVGPVGRHGKRSAHRTSSKYCAWDHDGHRVVSADRRSAHARGAMR